MKAVIPLCILVAMRVFSSGAVGEADNETSRLLRRETTSEDNVIPYHYIIKIKPIFDENELPKLQYTAHSKVSIFAKVQGNTSRITLDAIQDSNPKHARGNRLKVLQETLKVSGISQEQSLPINVSRLIFSKKNDSFIIELGNEVKVGENIMIYLESKTDFEKNIRLPSYGLVANFYNGSDGKSKRTVSTAFDRMYASTVYPCFTAPHFKTTFELTVARRKQYSTLANFELIYSKPDPLDPNWIEDRFAKTGLMTTSDVSFFISNFGHRRASFGGGKSLKIYFQRELDVSEAELDRLAENAVKVLNYYEEYFNDTMRLPKLDIIAHPNFYTKLKVNWGLVIIDAGWLANTLNGAYHNIKTTTVVEAIAYQWYANSDSKPMYLHDGVKQFILGLGQEALESDTSLLNSARITTFQDALSLDKNMPNFILSNSSQSHSWNRLAEVKAVVIFRMIAELLPKDSLRKGLLIFVSRSYNSSVIQADDLFDALQEASAQVENSKLSEEITIPKIMRSWCDQPGFPIVKVGIVNETHISLSQKRNDNDEIFGKWYVPITIFREDQTGADIVIQHIWLTDKTPTIITAHNTSKWVMINYNATGYFRTMYDDALLQLLAEQLTSNWNLIPPSSRGQLIDDYFTWAKIGKISLLTTLKLTPYMNNEMSYIVWQTFLKYFGALFNKLSFHPEFPSFQAYFGHKIDTVLTSIGLQDDDANEPWDLRSLRGELLRWSCRLSTPVCHKYAKVLFKKWKTSPGSNDPTPNTARKELHCAIIQAGGRDAFNFFIGRAVNGYLSTLPALACAAETEQLNELLNKTLSFSNSSQDVTAIVEQTWVLVAQNPKGASVLLYAVEEQFEKLVRLVGSVDLVHRVLIELSLHFITPESLTQMETCLDKVSTKLGINSRHNKYVSKIKENMNWMNKIGNDLFQWLQLQ